MNKLIWVIAAVLLIYTILPTLLVRMLHSFKKRGGGNGIALTFDDGPDPEYTPRLLDLLATYQVKATFFVLGSKAAVHPDLILRMHNEGHLVGIHNYEHWTNAFMTPKKVRKQLEESSQVIENIIGLKPVYYRPPWGIINLFDLFRLKKFRLVLWSLMVGDWRTSGGKQRIVSKLFTNLKNNDIIVLHDSDQTLGAELHAPVYMLAALHDFLEETKRRGCVFLRIDAKMQLDELTRQNSQHFLKNLFVFLWLKWEQFFHWLYNIHPIDANDPIFYSRLRKYHGQTIDLDNGEQICAGDLVVELHFNNQKLHHLISESNSMVQLAVTMIRHVQFFLPSLTQYIQRSHEIRGVYGITMIHRGSRQLGFTVQELPNGFFSFMTRIYLKLLLFVLHPGGKQRLELKKDLLTPRIVAISVQELKSRYSQKQTE